MRQQVAPESRAWFSGVLRFSRWEERVAALPARQRAALAAMAAWGAAAAVVELA
jgi:hypothetical protein